MWRALRRPTDGEDGEPDPIFRRVLHCYQILSVAKAQTVLRYWNWSLSSAYSPSSGLVEDNGDLAVDNGYSAAKKTASLLFGGR